MRGFASINVEDLRRAKLLPNNRHKEQQQYPRSSKVNIAMAAAEATHA
jgi:hypothetical protein